MLAEDAGRTIQLDSLEMKYYRAIATDPRARRPLQAPGWPRLWPVVPRRHERHPAGSRCPSCGDASLASNPSPRPDRSHRVWRASRRQRSSRRCRSGRRRSGTRWPVGPSDGRLPRPSRRRVPPSETPQGNGGRPPRVRFDLDKHSSTSSTRSLPRQTARSGRPYIRGCRGLRAKVDEVATRTDGMLEYIGEWHSHPSGCSTAPCTMTPGICLADRIDERRWSARIDDDRRRWRTRAVTSA